MRLLTLFIILTLFTVNAQAQKKKKDKKETTKETPKEKEEQLEIQFDAEVVVEEAPSEITPRLTNLSDAQGVFYLNDTYSNKDLATVYRNMGSGGRIYGLLKISTQKLITPFVFESLSSHFYTTDYATVGINGLYGTINSKGESIIPCTYDKFSNFLIDDQIYFIASMSGKFGVVNAANEDLIPFEYDNLSTIYRINTLLKATKGLKSGIINPVSKKIVVPFEYDELEAINSTHIRVKKDSKFNLINTDGEIIFKNWYTTISYNDDGWFIANLNGKYGVIDPAEKILIPFEYDRLERTYSEGYPYLAQKEGKYGTLSRTGEPVIPIIYNSLQKMGTNYMATLGDVKGIISPTGQVMLPLEYENIEQINQNILVRKKGNSMLFNKDLISITAQQYDDIKPMYFENGYSTSNFIVTKDGKKGIIDGTGKVVMDIKYENFIATSSGYRSYYKLPLIAVKGGKHGMVDLNNKVVIPFEYEHLLPLNSFLTIVGKNGKFGVIEIYNPATIVMPIEYKFITFKQGKNLVAYKEKFLKFNVNGSKVTPAE